MKNHSSSKVKERKPTKTYDYPPKPSGPDFPLTPNGAGYWIKKIAGKIQTFGRWGKVVNGTLTRIREDGCWQEALEEYKKRQAGTVATNGKEVLTIGGLCNSFLTSKLLLMQSGEITARTFAEYRATTDRLVARFKKDKPVDDLEAMDFERLRAEIAKTWGPVRLGNEITRVKTVFKYGRKSDLIPPEFKKPSKGVLRKHRATKDKKLFSSAEIRALLEAASPQLKAMILLAVNCGFGNDDCATLSQSVVGLEAGWIAYARRKTGIDRRCPLWPETATALKVAITDRPEPKDAADSDLVFVTKYGKRWIRQRVVIDDLGMPESTAFDSISPEFRKLLDKLKLNRPGIGFYALRHTFRTVADAVMDDTAIRAVMGHTDGSIDATYREEIDDSRLKAVTDHVHAWLFPVVSGEKKGG